MIFKAKSFLVEKDCFETGILFWSASIFFSKSIIFKQKGNLRKRNAFVHDWMFPQSYQRFSFVKFELEDICFLTFCCPVQKRSLRHSEDGLDFANGISSLESRIRVLAQSLEPTPAVWLQSNQ